MRQSLWRPNGGFAFICGSGLERGDRLVVGGLVVGGWKAEFLLSSQVPEVSTLLLYTDIKIDIDKPHLSFIDATSRSSPQAFGPCILPFQPTLAFRQALQRTETFALGGFLHRIHISSGSNTTLLLISLSPTFVSQITAAGLSSHGLALETRILNRTQDGWAVVIISLCPSFLRPSLAERQKRMSVSLPCSI